MDKRQAVNPYLPSYEYVPDGEPHLFWSEKDGENRVYVYGSHDAFGAPIFCVNDYVCWSAPEKDLTDWRYEGVIFRKKQDPQNPLGIRSLYAPDCVQGTDGKFYLYYAFDFMGRMGVAVCDEPAGKYEFYGYVHFPNGRVWGTKSGEPFPFDPGVLVDDDGRVWLYHRQTDRTSYARQACAEKLERTPDGGLKQAEITSCGLNGGPLAGKGTYEARIVCNLWAKDGTGRYDCKSPRKAFAEHPYFTQSGKDRESDGDQYIANMQDGSVAGFKYFDLTDAENIEVRLRGSAKGQILVATDRGLQTLAAEIPVDLDGGEKTFRSAFQAAPGKQPLYFGYVGNGSVDFLSFTLK